MTAPTASSRPTGQGWSIIAVCFSILIIEGYDLAMFGSIVPSLKEYEAWALSASTIGYMGSATVFGMLLGALSAAGLADRIGRRPVIIAAVSLFSLAMGLSALAPNPEIFLALRLIIGIGAGAVMPTVAATLIEYAPADRKTRNSALGFIGVGIGGMISGGLAIWLVPTFGFRSMCIVGALPLVLLVPALIKYLPESVEILTKNGRMDEARALAEKYGVDREPSIAAESRTESSENRFALVFADGRRTGTILFWIATFFCLLVTFGVGTWLPELMRSGGYGLSASLGFVIALKGGAVVGVLAAAQLADRFGQKPVVTATFMAAAASLILLSLTPHVVVAYILVAVIGLGTTGLQILINAFVGTYYPARVRATGLGLNLSIGRIGGVLGPMYLGWLVAGGIGFEAKFYALAIPAVLGSIFIAFVPTRKNTTQLVPAAVHNSRSSLISQ